MKPGYVYLMANHRRGQTYMGVTSDLPQRAWQHRNKVVEGHSKDKDCVLLVWYERVDDLQEARACEHRMKKWHRAWKLRLIEEQNRIGRTSSMRFAAESSTPAFAGVQ